MAQNQLAGVLQHLRRLIVPPQTRDLGDAALLERFIVQRDETAFATLLGRYGPLVLRVCRQVLQHEHDAEDAFQATFLILARKAVSVRHGQALPAWLHRVAYHVAVQARGRAARRRNEETQGEAMRSDDTLHQVEWRELGPVLHAEVNRLPAKYRQPIVLCYLDGRTHEQAAGQLGWPVGTVRTRLSRGRDLLQTRLLRRGVTPALGTFAGILAASAASASVPAALAELTLKASLRVAAGETAAASGVSATVVSLMEGVLHTMFLSRLKITIGLVLVILLISGISVLWSTSRAAPPRKPIDQVQAKGDRPAVVQGNTAFALDLYSRLRGAKGNLFLSPYSISTALAMTSAGARGDTLAQMNRTLHFPFEPDRLHPAFGSLIEAMRGDGKPRGYQLNVANALWCQSGYPFLDDFLSLNETCYGAQPIGLEFGRTEEARQAINGWVEKQTQDKIKDLLKPGIIDPDTRLVLTNAIYFKGDWAVPFKKEDTFNAPFALSATEKVNVPLMQRDGKFNYLAGDTFQALELPYAGKDLSMVIFLPREAGGLAEFEATLTVTNLNQWLGRLREKELAMYLPKFKTTAEFSLKKVLVSLGMSDAFDPERADLSGVGGRKDLFIAAVVHKAFIEVNEQGSEAAAATAVKEEENALPLAFRADRPFLFLIRDQRTGSILFLGRLVDPRS